MSKSKLNISILFFDNEENQRFLFKILCYGKKSNELKFVFNKPTDANAIIYSELSDKYPESTLIRSYGELSYHEDGTLMWKYPPTDIDKDLIRNNPHGEGTRRTPLKSIGEWEPLFMSNIIRYKSCKIVPSVESNVILRNINIFNGDPFEYYVYLGDRCYMTPPNTREGEFVQRVNDITENLDLTIWVRKSSYYGEEFPFGEGKAWNDNNRIKMIEPRINVVDGAVQIDLKMLMNTEWNGNVINDNMKLNITLLKYLSPMTSLCKSYLKDNPYLCQIKKLVGVNKAFSVSVLFGGIELNHKMLGILDKDEKGIFLGIGSAPKN